MFSLNAFLFCGTLVFPLNSRKALSSEAFWAGMLQSLLHRCHTFFRTMMCPFWTIMWLTAHSNVPCWICSFRFTAMNCPCVLSVYLNLAIMGINRGGRFLQFVCAVACGNLRIFNILVIGVSETCYYTTGSISCNLFIPYHAVFYILQLYQCCKNVPKIFICKYKIFLSLHQVILLRF